jgi:hypothetical protein
MRSLAANHARREVDRPEQSARDTLVFLGVRELLGAA